MYVDVDEIRHTFTTLKILINIKLKEEIYNRLKSSDEKFNMVMMTKKSKHSKYSFFSIRSFVFKFRNGQEQN